MSESWQVDGPRILEVGGEGEPVRELRVGLVAGRVDVVAHPADAEDGAGARLEVTDVKGRPLEVTWDGGVLSVQHPKVTWDGLLESIKAMARRDDRAEISVAVPAGAKVRVSTVSADGLVAGLRQGATVRTVSGELAVDDVQGDVAARTISGRIDVRDLRGSLSGESVSGSIVVQAAELPHLDVKTVSGELVVDLHTAPSKVDMKSVSGDLVVRIPGDSGFRLDARSVSGQIVADGRRIGAGRPGPPQGEIRDGDESVRVSATSVSGDVTLLRKDAS
ncbi:MAG TPA: DUF4097 family beta strand repeat-containing protein [Angustibacter sp.]|nr:DUF4097 family beta strand repeat-containing protein [Angustibacter sp.]